MPIQVNTNNKSLKIFLWIILVSYLAILTRLIIFKRPLRYIKNFMLHQYSWSMAKANMHNANLHPFATIKLYWNSYGHAEYALNNLVGNIIGFIPMGLLLPLLFSNLRTFTRTVFMVFLFSLAFETFQLLSMLGVADVDDLILNTAGGIIGYILFMILGKMVVIK